MDMFSSAAEIMVLSLTGITFVAMAVLSAFDSVIDHKAIAALVRQKSNPVLAAA